MESLLTSRQVADKLNLCDSTVRRHCRRRTLKGIKMGRDWMIPLAEVERFELDPPRPGNPNFGHREKTGNDLDSNSIADTLPRN